MAVCDGLVNNRDAETTYHGAVTGPDGRAHDWAPATMHLPFHNVYFTGIIRATSRPSKSLGNSLTRLIASSGRRLALRRDARRWARIFCSNSTSSWAVLCNNLNACWFRQMV